MSRGVAVFLYKDEITLNNKFNKSTNIIHDKEDCEHYIITQSTKDTLRTFFKLDYHNSLALIGPFGCGKSSLLLYINTLLSQNKESKKCIEALKKSNRSLYDEYKLFIDKKSFLRVKIVGEHTSFKDKFRDAILETSSLKKLSKYLKENKVYQMSKALELLNKDIENSNYSDVLFSVDEFGKFIEYGLEESSSNDIFELQTLAEYVNKQSNYKLIISLHKAFGEYSSKLSTVSYSDWDKIQGRFESIVFKDDYYEMLNIFKETIVLQNSKVVKEAQKVVYEICENSMLKESEENRELFEKIIPIHPFSAIVISEIFTRYFQNQRSIFSFLFSTEPFAFQAFISEKRNGATLYSLSDLYRYVGYLLKVYNILLPDRELWYLAEHRLKNYGVKDKLKIELIQIIALIHTFKLANVIKTNKEYLVLSLMDRYLKDEIIKEIEILSKEGLLLFQEKTQSFSLIEEANIDINKELEKRLSQNSSLNLEKELNRFILNKTIVAKRYFSEYGSKKSFEKIYVNKSEKLFNEPYRLFLSSKKKNELVGLSKKQPKSLFIPINSLLKIEELVQKIEALSDIKEEFNSTISVDTNEILDNMIGDYTIGLEKLLNDGSINNTIVFNGKEYLYSNQKLQQLMSDIIEKSYPDAPQINNYTFNHTLVSKGTNTTHVKKLFEAMLANSEKEYLGIDKYPAHKALYLSVIEPAGIHQKVNGEWKLISPRGLNFEKVWVELNKILVKKISIEKVVEKLAKEPYGLNDVTAMFVISLYILVNEEKMHIISDNTYKYTLTLDLLMHMWKATNRYQLQRIKLNRDEANLFKAYVEIATDLTEYSYSKDKVASIVKTLHSKFTLLPHYAKNTQKLSKEAISLRSALISMKDPKEAFFSMFPKALGYGNIENINNNEFNQKFKKAFNEIALVYKQELGELEIFLSEIFHFENSFFPYANGLVNLSEKLSVIDGLDMEIKALLRSFNFSNNFLELIDNISVIVIQKKIEDCYDNDINILKDKLKVIANKVLSKLELADVVTEQKDVRKISLASLDENLNRVISIDKSKLDTINQKALKLKEMIPSEYSQDEKLFLISQLLNEELKNE
jgi:energy-coupling factor transporter ATP-binding protein EcfA2